MSNPLTAVPLRAARWSATHPWRAIGAWLLLVAIAVGLAAMIPTRATVDADYRQGESGRAAVLYEAGGFTERDQEQILIRAADGSVVAGPEMPGAAPGSASGSAQAAVRDLRASLAGLDDVHGVGRAIPSPDGRALLLGVELTRESEGVAPVRRAVQAAADAHPDLDVGLAGVRSIDDGIGDQVSSDLAVAEGVSLPVTLLLMLLAFGALIAAGTPVLLAATSVATTIGLMAPLSHLIPAEDTVSSMIVLIGMAVGVDYSLFYLKREREERAAGHGTRDAVRIAAETSGHSILVSGGAVVAAMTGLFVMGGATFNSLAAGSILVVAVAVLGSITVLPALLVVLGRWIDRPRVPLLWRLNRRIGAGGISSRLLAPVLRHPAASALLGAVVLGALAAPALGLRTHSSNLDTLPASIPEVATMRSIEAAFPGQGTEAQLLVRAPADQAPQVREALHRVQQSAVASGDFVADGASVTTSPDGRVSLLRITTSALETEPGSDRAVEALRGSLGDRPLSRWQHAVGGGVAESIDLQHQLSTRLPWVIGFVLVLTLVVMLATFRSLPLALVSALLNLGSVGVAFGMLALVFQHGWGAGLLDFTTPGFVIDWIPVFVLVVLVGLSMDYHVFVLSRIREHVQRGVPAREAVALGIRSSAGVVTSAAAVMVSVFAIFATLSMLEMKMLGVGLCAAILLDATLVRLVLLPAALVLLGERAWGRTPRPRPVGVRPDARPEPALSGGR